ncbi:MAG: hypothetical protein AAF363_11905 [Bacteroidota bacterium]
MRKSKPLPWSVEYKALRNKIKKYARSSIIPGLRSGYFTSLLVVRISTVDKKSAIRGTALIVAENGSVAKTITRV